MEPIIPTIVEELYCYFVTQPEPSFWPEHLKSDPVKGHGLWAFYQGLCLGMQLSAACLNQD